MKIFKMFLFGIIGVLISCIFYFALTLATTYIFGLVVSALGSLVAGHAILGYIGKDKIEPKDYKRLLWIGGIWALLGAVAPCLIFGFTGFDVLFIFIGVLGGIEMAKILIRQSLYSSHRQPAPERHTIKIDFKTTLGIYSQKLILLFRGYILTTAVILFVGNFLIKGIGVSWIILAGMIIYRFFQFKIWIITDRDIEFFQNKSFRLL